MSKAYLKGIIHDGTEREYTFRISQKSLELIERIAEMVENLGFDAWTYEEGNRGVHVVEFSKKAVEDFEAESPEEKQEYVRGYFDAEGSVPRSQDTRFYIYFAQKDRDDIEKLQSFVEELGIQTGKLHRPSKSSRPDYWRFYIPTLEHEKFARQVGSRHPSKEKILKRKTSTPPA
jgi:DNA-binding transcriptional regulator WhiA